MSSAQTAIAGKTLMLIVFMINLSFRSANAQPCDNSTSLCLNDSRFEVAAIAFDSSGMTLAGQPVPLTQSSGAFRFAASDQLDVAIKILDGSRLNGSFWVFYTEMTTLKYQITVTDTVTGTTNTYAPPGTASLGDFPVPRAGNFEDLHAQCSFSPSMPRVGEPVQFTDNSLGSPDQWKWAFGDRLGSGYDAEIQTPLPHSYNLKGTYSVKLRVFRKNGTVTATDVQTCAQINVRERCLFSFDQPDTIKVFPDGSTKMIKVTAQPADCMWSADSDNTALFTVAAPANGKGTGSGTILLNVQANDRITTRSGSLTIRGENGKPVKTFSITQEGAPCEVSLPPSGASFGPAKGSGSIRVAAPIGCHWSATASPADVVKLTGSMNGNGNGTLFYNVSPNPNTAARTATVSVQGKPFTITQARCTVNFDASPLGEVGPELATPSLRIRADSSTCGWPVSSTGAFFNVLSPPPYMGNRPLGLQIAENTSSLPRTGSLTIGETTTPSRQRGCASIASPVVSFGADATTGTVHVTALDNCHWKAESNADFLQVVGGGVIRTGSGDVSFNMDENLDVLRVGSLSVGGQMVIAVQQGGSPEASCARLTGQEAVGKFTPSGGVGQLGVQADTAACEWQVETGATSSFVQFMGQGSGSGSVSFCVAANRGGQRGARLALFEQSSPERRSFFDIFQELPLGGDPTLPCRNSESTLCLHGNRFEVRVTSGNTPEARGEAHAVHLRNIDGTGYFWFTDPANPEVFVKVLTQGGTPRVFVGALTDSPYAVTITDTTNPGRALFCNLDGKFKSSGELEVTPLH